MIAKEFTVNPAGKTRFDRLYQRHLRALKLQDMSDKTIDVYVRAVRRIAQYYDCCPDRLTTEQLQVYFASVTVHPPSKFSQRIDSKSLISDEAIRPC
jgi:hypothetical protein